MVAGKGKNSEGARKGKAAQPSYASLIIEILEEHQHHGLHLLQLRKRFGDKSQHNGYNFAEGWPKRVLAKLREMEANGQVIADGTNRLFFRLASYSQNRPVLKRLGSRKMSPEVPLSPPPSTMVNEDHAASIVEHLQSDLQLRDTALNAVRQELNSKIEELSQMMKEREELQGQLARVEDHFAVYRLEQDTEMDREKERKNVVCLRMRELEEVLRTKETILRNQERLAEEATKANELLIEEHRVEMRTMKSSFEEEKSSLEKEIDRLRHINQDTLIQFAEERKPMEENLDFAIKQISSLEALISTQRALAKQIIDS